MKHDIWQSHYGKLYYTFKDGKYYYWSDTQKAWFRSHNGENRLNDDYALAWLTDRMQTATLKGEFFDETEVSW